MTTTATGHKTYQFVNKLTGEYLALKLDVAANAKLDATGNKDWAMTAETGGYLYAYDAAKDSTYYLTEAMALTREKGLPATPGVALTLATTMDAVSLTAQQFNALMGMPGNDGKLHFNGKDVSDGQTNILKDTKWTAVKESTNASFFLLNGKESDDVKNPFMLMVDTAAYNTDYFKLTADTLSVEGSTDIAAVKGGTYVANNYAPKGTKFAHQVATAQWNADYSFLNDSISLKVVSVPTHDKFQSVISDGTNTYGTPADALTTDLSTTIADVEGIEELNTAGSNEVGYVRTALKKWYEKAAGTSTTEAGGFKLDLSKSEFKTDGSDFEASGKKFAELIAAAKDHITTMEAAPSSYAYLGTDKKFIKSVESLNLIRTTPVTSAKCFTMPGYPNAVPAAAVAKTAALVKFSNLQVLSMATEAANAISDANAEAPLIQPFASAPAGDADITSDTKLFFIQEKNVGHDAALRATTETNKYLVATGNASAPYTALAEEVSNENPYAQWAFVPSASGSYQILNRATGYALYSGMVSKVKDADGNVVADTYVVGAGTLKLAAVDLSGANIYTENKKQYDYTGYFYAGPQNSKVMSFEIAPVSPFMSSLALQVKADSTLILGDAVEAPVWYFEEKAGTTYGLTISGMPQLKSVAYKVYMKDAEGTKYFIVAADTNDKFVITKEDSQAGANAKALSFSTIAKDTYLISDGAVKMTINPTPEKPNIEATDVTNNLKNDYFTVGKSSVNIYRTLTAEDGVNGNAAIYMNNEDSRYLYENSANIVANNGNKVAKDSLNFLGIFNAFELDKNPTLYVDTAYVERDGNIMPQYMFAVGVEDVEATAGTPCTESGVHVDKDGKATTADKCVHATPATKGYKAGRYLVSVADSAALYAKHPANYDNTTRFAFVPAKHYFGEDSLVLDNSKYTGTTNAKNDTLKIADNALNAATFALLIKDQADKSFYLQTKGGYVRILNGVPVITANIEDAAIFNIEASELEATANEAIEASQVTVIGGQGVVTVQGAAGKVITVANILGQTIANQVAASDNVTIAAPAGVVVVAVEGEATKVVVK